MTRDELFALLRQCNIVARKYFYPLISAASCYSALPADLRDIRIRDCPGGVRSHRRSSATGFAVRWVTGRSRLSCSIAWSDLQVATPASLPAFFDKCRYG